MKTLEQAIAEAGLIPVSWAKCLCRRCGDFRLSLPRMPRKCQLMACPRCGTAIWATETARGGTRQQLRIEDEAAFSQTGFAPFNSQELADVL